MIKNKVILSSMAAIATTETAIGSFTVPDGHNYNVVELNRGLPANTIIYVYIIDERVLTLDKSVAEDNRRLVLNWNLTPGMEIRVTGQNNTGAVADVGVTFIYDDVPA